MKEPDLVPYETIVAAANGDADAMQTIIHHYTPYIKHFSQRHYRDDYGNTFTMIDDDVRQQIEIKLMYEIAVHFDCSSLPDGEILDP